MRRIILSGVAVAVLGCGNGGATVPDARAIDGAVDAQPDASIDAGPLSADAGADPTLLSMQGVYGNFALRTLPVDALAYDVRWELWADGATKRRWLILSPGSAPIDNTDQEQWQFPVGARLVKEFTRDTKLVETRIVERTGPGAADYSMRTYVWATDGSEAALDTDGAIDVAGTPHNAPTAAQCLTCHNGETGKVLGFSAVQLMPATLASLSAAGRLSTPIPAATTFGPTGSAAAVDALGYLHAGCGHCHNPNGVAAASNNLTLRLDAASKAADQEPGWITSVNVAVTGNGLGATLRIQPMTPLNSAILTRMSVRGAGQMPQIASEIVDPTGIATVTTWVNSLP